MKLANANKIRQSIVELLFDEMSNRSEDCGMITSNTFNFPIVAEDGEEGWVEITVKVPKDEGDDGYLKREEYALKLKAKVAKAEESAKRKAEKIAKDKAKKEAKRLERERLAKEVEG